MTMYYILSVIRSHCVICDNEKSYVKVKVKQSPYRPGVTQRVPGS